MSGKLTLAALLIGGLLMLAALQRQLIYFPEVVSEHSLPESAQRMGLRAWRDSSGGLIGWRASRHSDAEHRVVVFHGNAGHALHRLYFAAGFLSRDDAWEIYLFEYPGYGARPGSPSESAIKSAAADALEELLREDTQPLFLVGEALGSGVATDLAARFSTQTAGVLLVTPFTSLADVARRHYGYLPVDLLLRERYDSEQALAAYHGPVAFLIAGRDEIVPAELGRRLHTGYDGPKLLLEQPGAGHNSLDFAPGSAWWQDVIEFWLAHRPTTRRTTP